MINRLDFIGVPSQDAERSRSFYIDTLGLRPDEHGRFEAWLGETCFGIWEPAQFGMDFAPQKNAHPARHVDDVAAARAELEAKGVEFAGETMDTGAWRSSPTRTATTSCSTTATPRTTERRLQDSRSGRVARVARAAAVCWSRRGPRSSVQHATSGRLDSGAARM